MLPNFLFAFSHCFPFFLFLYSSPLEEKVIVSVKIDWLMQPYKKECNLQDGKLIFRGSVNNG